MNYQTKPIKVNAVQYGYAEYADNPLLLKDGFSNHGTQWVEDLLKEGLIKPVFNSKDYWYLKVYTINDDLLVPPGYWLIQEEDGSLIVMSDDDFKKKYERLNG